MSHNGEDVLSVAFSVCAGTDSGASNGITETSESLHNTAAQTKQQLHGEPVFWRTV